MQILNVRIDNLSKKQTLQKVQDFLNSDEQHTIFTPNPEMLVEAHKDRAFRDILNCGSLNICDGKGIQLVVKGVERIPGIDFMLDICKLAQEQGKSIYLLGAGKTGGPEAAAAALKRQFSKLNIVGFNKGPKIEDLRLKDYKIKRLDFDLIEDINSKAPDILFVGFGHKKQEFWIHYHLEKMPSIKIAMGVGGAFDYIGKNVKRAPKWMRKIGLEWLYRLFKQPRRIGRIWNAIVKFLFIYYFKK